jgi:hypothetical protein
VWMIQHTSETRHNRYRRTLADYQIWSPTEPVPAPQPVPPLEPAKVDRVRT